MAKFGMPGSEYQQIILKQNPGKAYTDLFEPYEFLDLKSNSLLVWLIWISSWLKRAGSRSAPLDLYLPPTKELGTIY
jgi:hypothetical protein